MHELIRCVCTSRCTVVHTRSSGDTTVDRVCTPRPCGVTPHRPCVPAGVTPPGWGVRDGLPPRPPCPGGVPSRYTPSWVGYPPRTPYPPSRPPKPGPGRGGTRPRPPKRVIFDPKIGVQNRPFWGSFGGGRGTLKKAVFGGSKKA